MNCKKAKELMSEYIDGMIDKNKLSDFEAHIKDCSKCSEELKILSVIKDSCSDLPEEKLPILFDEELHKKLDAEKRKKNFYKKQVPVIASFAAVIVIVFIYSNTGLFNNGFEEKNDSLLQEKSRYQTYDVPQNGQLETANEDNSAAKNEGMEKICVLDDNSNTYLNECGVIQVYTVENDKKNISVDNVLNLVKKELEPIEYEITGNDDSYEILIYDEAGNINDSVCRIEDKLKEYNTKIDFPQSFYGGVDNDEEDEVQEEGGKGSVKKIKIILRSE